MHTVWWHILSKGWYSQNWGMHCKSNNVLLQKYKCFPQYCQMSNHNHDSAKLQTQATNGDDFFLFSLLIHTSNVNSHLLLCHDGWIVELTQDSSQKGCRMDGKNWKTTCCWLGDICLSHRDNTMMIPIEIMQWWHCFHYLSKELHIASV